jgi:hypothetical protein
MSRSKNISPVGWYVATYALRFVELDDEGIEDAGRKFRVWENTIIVKAGNLDEAYDRVVEVGMEASQPYKGGPHGVDMQWRFEGVLSLLPIYEELEDGSEISWAERRPRTLANIRKEIRGKGGFEQ